MRLIAKFDIRLVGGLFLFNRPMAEDFRYRTAINGFDVELILNPYAGAYRNMGGPFAETSYWGAEKVTVCSARDEDADPPSRDAAGTGDESARLDYFRKREPDYRRAAWEILNRALLFFKYRLRNPLLSVPVEASKQFQNPIWMDGSGNELNIGGATTAGTPLPVQGDFGVRCLSPNADPDLQRALEDPISPDLGEELLADAQYAVFEGDFSRAVLKMAIACETAVKRAFFAKSTPAGTAYEYLEDNGKVDVRVIDLIGAVAKEAFGTSFKEARPRDYTNIDLLFRCRNKVAHRGELVYRNGAGIHAVDRDKLLQWWGSVEKLFAWLHESAYR